ncbi:hypothetical protein D3C87_914180 [compost metagenome]
MHSMKCCAAGVDGCPRRRTTHTFSTGSVSRTSTRRMPWRLKLSPASGSTKRPIKSMCPTSASATVTEWPCSTRVGGGNPSGVNSGATALVPPWSSPGRTHSAA